MSSQKSLRSSLRHLGLSKLAWNVALFMGLQSLTFYILITWLPDILIDRGISAFRAGWMLSVLQATGCRRHVCYALLGFRPSASEITGINHYISGTGGDCRAFVTCLRLTADFNSGIRSGIQCGKQFRNGTAIYQPPGKGYGNCKRTLRNVSICRVLTGRSRPCPFRCFSRPG